MAMRLVACKPVQAANTPDSLRPADLYAADQLFMVSSRLPDAALTLTERKHVRLLTAL
jgi:hypothetical protein